MLLIVSCCVGCDQVTKDIAKHTLQYSTTRSWAHDTIRLQYRENPGAFLSFGAHFSHTVRFWMFIVLPGIFLGSMLAFCLLSPTIRRKELLALCLLVGGGMGNLVDRVFQDGGVVDFLNIGLGTVRTGIFNVADVMIMFGTGMLIWFNLFYNARRREVRENSSTPG